MQGGITEYTPADSEDTWYTAAIKHTEVPNELKQIKFWEDSFKVPSEQRPWPLEASGRLLSRCDALRATAEARAASENARLNTSKRRFFGVRYSDVSTLRQFGRVDVYLEPTDDPAHSNLVVVDPSDCDIAGEMIKISQDLALCLDALMPFVTEADPRVAELEKRCTAQ